MDDHQQCVVSVCMTHNCAWLVYGLYVHICAYYSYSILVKKRYVFLFKSVSHTDYVNAKLDPGKTLTNSGMELHIT